MANARALVAVTREGRLFVWDTPSPSVPGSVVWQGLGHDRRNTRSLSSGVSPAAPPPASE